VDGTPADCVLLAFRGLLRHQPQVVLSGINLGYNVGEDIDYSGTVGAAAEGAQQGARLNMAVSTGSEASPEQLARAAEAVVPLTEKLLAHGLPERSYVNVNVPTGVADIEFRWARQGNPLGAGTVMLGTDPRGKKYYWIAERPEEPDPPDDTDRGVLMHGLAPVTLLTLCRDWHGRWRRPEL